MNLNGKMCIQSIVVDDFKDVIKEVKVFPLICIYKNPSDFPEFFVARLFDGGFPTRYICTAESLEDINSKISKNMDFVERSPLDEAHIIGTWI